MRRILLDLPIIIFCGIGCVTVGDAIGIPIIGYMVAALMGLYISRRTKN
jgi:hypothetical protein